MATPGTLSPEALSYYAQMGIPVPQQQQPDLSSYAPQPAQQAAPQLRPSPARQEYVNLIQSRMQELIQQAGGAERVARLGLMEVAQKKAMEDVAMLYGEAPAIEKPIRVESVGGINFAIGPTGQPIQLPTEMERQAQELAVKKAQAELTQAEKEARDKQFERVNKLEMGLNQFDEGVRIIDQLLADPRLEKGVGANAFFAALPATEARAIANMINQIKGQNFLNAYESLRGGGGISQIEGQKAEQAMGRIDQYMEEKDLRQALEELRNRYDYARQKAQLGLQYFGASEGKQAQPTATQTAPSPAAPAEPRRISSPGTIKLVRDPATGELIRQQ